jgi:hypothetical protein
MGLIAWIDRQLKREPVTDMDVSEGPLDPEFSHKFSLDGIN